MVLQSSFSSMTWSGTTTTRISDFGGSTAAGSRPDTAPQLASTGRLGFSASTSMVRPDSVSHIARISRAKQIRGRSANTGFYERGERFVYNKPHISTKFKHIDIVAEIKNPLQDTKPLRSQFDCKTQSKILKNRCSGFGGTGRPFRSCHSFAFSGDVETGRLPASRVFNKDYKDYKGLTWDRKHTKTELDNSSNSSGKGRLDNSSRLALGTKVEVLNSQTGLWQPGIVSLYCHWNNHYNILFDDLEGGLSGLVKSTEQAATRSNSQSSVVSATSQGIWDVKNDKRNSKTADKFSGMNIPRSALRIVPTEEGGEDVSNAFTKQRLKRAKRNEVVQSSADKISLDAVYKAKRRQALATRRNSLGRQAPTQCTYTGFTSPAERSQRIRARNPNHI